MHPEISKSSDMSFLWPQEEDSLFCSMMATKKMRHNLKTDLGSVKRKEHVLFITSTIRPQKETKIFSFMPKNGKMFCLDTRQTVGTLTCFHSLTIQKDKLNLEKSFLKPGKGRSHVDMQFWNWSSRWQQIHPMNHQRLLAPNLTPVRHGSFRTGGRCHIPPWWLEIHFSMQRPAFVDMNWVYKIIETPHGLMPAVSKASQIYSRHIMCTSLLYISFTTTLHSNFNVSWWPIRWPTVWKMGGGVV